MRHPTLDEASRQPLLKAAQRERLQTLREHPQAPHYTYACGDMLTAPMLTAVRAFRTAVFADWPRQAHSALPAWLTTFTLRCLQQVPQYRRFSTPRLLAALGDRSPQRALQAFQTLPTCHRGDLASAPEAFVPDDVPLNELVVYNTSGTTGNSVSILSHPVSASAGLVLLERALSTQGVKLEGGNRVSVVAVGDRLRTLTYPSISSYLDGAAFVKLNLRASDWKQPDDRQAFLNHCNPEIYTGDPVALATLAELPLMGTPKALISSTMTMSEALRQRLENHFGCPVLDVYGLTECPGIGVHTPQGYRLLDPALYVEILDAQGQPCAPGEHGEIVVSGGCNPYLPLLRYRTGDHARLELHHQIPHLVDLEGRSPVRFWVTEAGQERWINAIDITQALDHLPLTYLALHQQADNTLVMRSGPETIASSAIETALRPLLGTEARLEFASLPPEALERKIIRYSSERPDAL